MAPALVLLEISTSSLALVTTDRRYALFDFLTVLDGLMTASGCHLVATTSDLGWMPASPCRSGSIRIV
jgi:hypothetical protein